MNYYELTIHPKARIAANATIIGTVTIERDALVLFNATLRGDYGAHIVVGEGSNIQELCCLHVNENHSCIIGKGVTVGHGAIVHGCSVGDNTLVGMGSIIMDGAVVGKNCIVGAGALITGGTHIPDNSMVIGSPAKVYRSLTEQEIKQNHRDAQGYIAVGKNLVEDGIIYEGAHLPQTISTITIKERP